jgi:F0F1-type ATP synthase assembly protein I
MTQTPAKGTAGAGILLISTILIGAGLGLGIGAIVGAQAPLLIGGAAVGVVIGFWIVYSRFKEI